ncbi:MAG: TlpA family protein disulfide reductase, partial [Odoribacter sp.]|nr:TlpA family protein disulfide reductase [Odoribacter sp.]
MAGYDNWTLVKNKLDYIQKNFKSPKIQEFFVDQFSTEYVGRFGVDRLDEIVAIYDAKVTSPEKKAAFDKLCGVWAKIAKGQPSPTFKYLDINGKEVSLKDLAGKYVYIDVWATWCGPCRGELPHLKKLEHRFKGKNIAFVSISCDQDKSAWEKMVKEEKLGGIQLHNGGDREFMEAYM